MEDTLDIEPEHAIKLAKQHLAGNWLTSSVKTVSLKVLSGGYCSRLYLCEDLTGRCDPAKFLIRLMGGKVLEDEDPLKNYNEGTESLVFFMHGHLGYGPKLYGVINGGRLEEYIPSRALTDKDLENPDIRKQIARKLARFHSMQLPVSKKPHPSFELMLSIYNLYDTPEGRQRFLRNSELCGLDPSWEKTIDFRHEFDWMKQTLRQVGGRLVLSTNDMNKLNCLIRDVPDKFGEIVTLVDYEIGGTNWRGYDIGTHFLMRMVDVNAPDFKSGFPFAGVEQRRDFVEEYLRQTKAMNAYDNFDADGLDSCDHVLMEADLMAMMAVLFLGPFMLKPPKESNVFMSDTKQIFKFFSFGATMVNFYAEQKRYFVDKYGKLLNSKDRIVGRDIEIFNSTST